MGDEGESTHRMEEHHQTESFVVRRRAEQEAKRQRRKEETAQPNPSTILCDKCPRMFRAQVGLLRHQRPHHKETGVELILGHEVLPTRNVTLYHPSHIFSILLSIIPIPNGLLLHIKHLRY